MLDVVSDPLHQPRPHAYPALPQGALAITLRNEPRLLEQVCVDGSAGDRPVWLDEQPHELAEAAAVVVVGGARVTERLVVAVSGSGTTPTIVRVWYTHSAQTTCALLASKTTLDCSTQRETVESCTSSSSAETPILGDFIDSGFCPARQHRYCMMCLLASVLPAPETPETTIAWLPAVLQRLRYACSATAYRCGGQAPGRRSTYCFIVPTE